MNPIEIVKKHPVITTVGVVVVFGAVLMFSSGGTTEYADDAGASGEMAGAIALQQMQAAFQMKSLEVGAAKEVALNESATKVTLAQLQRDVALKDLEYSFNYQTAKLGAEERTTTLVSTLQAKTAADQIKANADATAAMFANIKSQQDAAATLAKVNAQTQVQLAEINARPRGLFSFLFG